MTTDVPSVERDATNHASVWLIGGAAALVGAVVTFPMLPPVATMLGAVGLVLAVVACSRATARRQRLTSALIAVLSAAVLAASFAVSSLMTSWVRAPEPPDGLPVQQIPPPND